MNFYVMLITTTKAYCVVADDYSKCLKTYPKGNRMFFVGMYLRYCKTHLYVKDYCVFIHVSQVPRKILDCEAKPDGFGLFSEFSSSCF